MVDIRPDKYPETALRIVLDVPYTYVFDFFLCPVLAVRHC